MLHLFANLKNKVGDFLDEAESLSERERFVEEVEFLTEQMRRLNAKLHKQTSAKHIFFNALLAGIGSAIGATMIAGIVIGVLAQTIQTIEDVPIVGNLVRNELIQNQFQKP